MTRGLLIAAPRSGSGKTTLALGLMRAFAIAGLRVAGAKSGPDYIDCAFHAAATRRRSVNLDTWAMTPNLIHGLAGLVAEDADLLIAEASMGLFDGVPAEVGRSGSSADLAASLGLPVVLALDISGQAQTAAAIVKGCMAYDPRIRIAGVVLNKVGSDRHRRLAGQAIEALGVPVLGSLPRDPKISLPERHLGLVQAEETSGLDEHLTVLAEFVSGHVDMAAIEGLAQPLRAEKGEVVCLLPPGQRIAIARDAAFTFIYPHLLMSWRRAGAEISFFSPLADEPPPSDADICWLPGGYPELHAGRLAGARRFLQGLRVFADSKPVHGECGGYMALGRSLTDAKGEVHAMADLLSVETSFARRKLTLGYRAAELGEDCALGRRGDLWLGHEFHYATIISAGTDSPFAICRDAYGSAPQPSGSRRGHVSGSFFHVIAAAGAAGHSLAPLAGRGLG
jgi:cobyrinic acid a,c-diamide synthase